MNGTKAVGVFGVGAGLMLEKERVRDTGGQGECACGFRRSPALGSVHSRKTRCARWRCRVARLSANDRKCNSNLPRALNETHCHAMTLAANPRSLVFYMAYPGPGNLDGASRSLIDGDYLLAALDARPRRQALRRHRADLAQVEEAAEGGRQAAQGRAASASPSTASRCSGPTKRT